METMFTLTPNSISLRFAFAKPHLHSVFTVKPQVVSITVNIPIQIDILSIIDIPLGLNLPQFAWQIIAPTTKIGAVFDRTLVKIPVYYSICRFVNFQITDSITENFSLVNLTLFWYSVVFSWWKGGNYYACS